MGLVVLATDHTTEPDFRRMVASERIGLYTARIAPASLVRANKVEAIRALGAEIRIVGRSQDDAQVEVDRLVREEGFATVPPFDHADVIAGQGTLGLEIIEAVPDAKLLLVPLSGGGLIAGVALAAKALRPRSPPASNTLIPPSRRSSKAPAPLASQHCSPAR